MVGFTEPGGPLSLSVWSRPGGIVGQRTWALTHAMVLAWLNYKWTFHCGGNLMLMPLNGEINPGSRWWLALWSYTSTGVWYWTMESLVHYHLCMDLHDLGVNNHWLFGSLEF